MFSKKFIAEVIASSILIICSTRGATKPPAKIPITCRINLIALTTALITLRTTVTILITAFIDLSMTKIKETIPTINFTPC
jgi:hypothetical protein